MEDIIRKLNLGEPVYDNMVDVVGKWVTKASIEEKDLIDFTIWKKLFDDITDPDNLCFPEDNDKVLILSISSENLMKLTHLLAYEIYKE